MATRKGKEMFKALAYSLAIVVLTALEVTAETQAGSVNFDVVGDQYSINGELVDKSMFVDGPNRYLPSDTTRVVFPRNVQVGELLKLGPVLSRAGVDMYYIDDGQLKQLHFGVSE